MSMLWGRDVYVKLQLLKTAKNVELEAYMGRWYEIARTGNEWEYVNKSNSVTADYTLLSDGRFRILNSMDGILTHEITGDAEVSKEDDGNNSKFKVTFGLLERDYWILEVGKKDKSGQYLYAIVGEPTRRHLWILARKPEMSESVLNKLIERAGNRYGYNTLLIKPNKQPS